ncbi:hypothetical protein ZWY2020_054379 [Hordeum vulgare]|nr:hypothetical protein ZWY2020_054379 [Hordeum vulgare]
MPPGGGGDGRMVQKPPPATDQPGGDEYSPSGSPAPLPVVAPEKKKRKKQQPAADIPDDVLREILKRVCYRSLCRFKQVRHSVLWFLNLGVGYAVQDILFSNSHSTYHNLENLDTV